MRRTRVDRQHLPVVTLDDLAQGVRDRRDPADWVQHAAVEARFGEHGDRRARDRGGAVAEVRGPGPRDRPQQRIANMPADEVRDGLAAVARERGPHARKILCRAVDRVGRREEAIDAARLAGEPRLQVGDERRALCRDRHVLAREVQVRERGDAAPSQVQSELVEEAPHGAPRCGVLEEMEVRLDVQPVVCDPALVAADAVAGLHDRDAPAAMREQRGRHQPAHAGADDDGVQRPVAGHHAVRRRRRRAAPRRESRARSAASRARGARRERRRPAT